MEASTPTPPPQPPSGTPAAGAYPVTADAERQAQYHRLLPFVKWLLAFPHYVVLAVLGFALFFAKIYAFFVVLFTGTYPRGVFDFVNGVFRWAWNVGSYVLLLNDRYPPFSLEADPSYPTKFEIAYPEDGVDNWRPLVHWLLVIPYAIVAGALGFVAGVVAFVGAFVILFTEELPEGMFKLILIPMRWQARTSAYAGFMVTRYPPFDWE